MKPYYFKVFFFFNSIWTMLEIEVETKERLFFYVSLR